jgi:cytochrome c peroxidase
MRFNKTILFVGLILSVLGSCKEVLEDQPSPSYGSVRVPSHFPQAGYKPSGYIPSEAVFQLGRKLFYDPILSLDSTVSCASCHRQDLAFSDAGNALSRGFSGRFGFRNSPALFNLAWNPAFMWDGGINHIEIMPVAPITDSTELNMSMAGLVERLRQDPDYTEAFRKAFGVSTPDDQKLLQALAWYMANIISDQSEYDFFLRDGKPLSEESAAGYSVFKRNCAACHSEPLLTDYSYRNNGSGGADPGRMRITQDPADRGKFKVPSLRNSALTAPYFHRGQKAGLEDVIKHYSEEIPVDADPLLRPEDGGFRFSETEKRQLLAFLHSLTDPALIQNKDLSAP